MTFAKFVPVISTVVPVTVEPVDVLKDVTLGAGRRNVN